jgi:isoleucyl-tRNA synthetase
MPETNTLSNFADGIQDNDWICDACDHSDACLERCEDLRGWIYEEQITHCINTGKPAYEEDEHWAVLNEDSTDR